MGTAFDTFDQYAFGAYEGQVQDLAMADIVSRLASGSDIAYGVGVFNDAYRSAAIPGDFNDKPTGITVRETVRDNDATDSPEYPQDHEMSVMRVGRIWVKADVAVAIGDPVHVIPTTGKITNTDATSTNPQLNNAEFLTATSGADEMALVQLNGTP